MPKTQIDFSDELYTFEKCTITVSCQILPLGESGEREVVISVGSHGDMPALEIHKYSEIAWPPQVESMLDTLREGLPERQLEAMKDKAKKKPKSAKKPEGEEQKQMNMFGEEK